MFVLGSGGSGKSSLVNQFVNHQLPQYLTPTPWSRGKQHFVGRVFLGRRGKTKDFRTLDRGTTGAQVGDTAGGKRGQEHLVQVVDTAGSEAPRRERRRLARGIAEGVRLQSGQRSLVEEGFVDDDDVDTSDDDGEAGPGGSASGVVGERAMEKDGGVLALGGSDAVQGGGKGRAPLDTDSGLNETLLELDSDDLLFFS